MNSARQISGPNHRFGFTLLELLVVISIIGILIAVGTAAFTAAQKKGRDAKRHGDIKAIQNAFEQYYAENGGYADTCADMADYMTGGILPTDPKTGVSYSTTCDSDATDNLYCVCALLEAEDSGNASGWSGDTTCSYGGVTQNYYCVSNLQ